MKLLSRIKPVEIRGDLRLSIKLTAAVMTLLAISSLLLGRYAISFHDLVAALQTALGHPDLESNHYEVIKAVVFHARLPRVITALIVGAGLAIAGSAFQAVFRNPLVSPGLLGVLNGCAFGAALGLVLQAGLYGVPLLACFFGCLAVAIGVLIAKRIGGDSILLLILGGIISNALFAGLLSLVKYMADPENQLPGIIYWLLGSLSSVSLPLLEVTLPIMVIAMALLLVLGRVLDAMSLGDDEALSLGIPVSTMRYGVIFLATIISAITVCIAGVVGWVGLLIPHLTRLIWGASHRFVLPLSALLGAIFLLIADDLARMLTSSEIPLGVVTELLGAVIFFFLLTRTWQAR
ncbi:FecCD family ABC transporter permease [Photobacterium damselae]|uniref:FecCD family ABC transporter permease n=1 Tax=Photobacterium damselae TaxID=38293 RepID=UPI001EFD2F11|nr:iron ABC transporter permease [Photobacterium damselae]MCG9777711.1 iron ABC transporter permease [Photobacterium damselae]